MADVDGLADRALFVRLDPCATLELGAMLARQLRRRFGVARQEREELLESLGIEREVRRELPEHRPELLLEQQHALRKEIRHRHTAVAQLLHVRDEPPALNREQK